MTESPCRYGGRRYSLARRNSTGALRAGFSPRPRIDHISEQLRPLIESCSSPQLRLLRLTLYCQFAMVALERVRETRRRRGMSGDALLGASADRTSLFDIVCFVCKAPGYTWSTTRAALLSELVHRLIDAIVREGPSDFTIAYEPAPAVTDGRAEVLSIVASSAAAAPSLTTVATEIFAQPEPCELDALALSLLSIADAREYLREQGLLTGGVHGESHGLNPASELLAKVTGVSVGGASWEEREEQLYDACRRWATNVQKLSEWKTLFLKGSVGKTLRDYVMGRTDVPPSFHAFVLGALGEKEGNRLRLDCELGFLEEWEELMASVACSCDSEFVEAAVRRFEEDPGLWQMPVKPQLPHSHLGELLDLVCTLLRPMGGDTVSDFTGSMLALRLMAPGIFRLSRVLRVSEQAVLSHAGEFAELVDTLPEMLDRIWSRTVCGVFGYRMGDVNAGTVVKWVDGTSGIREQSFYGLIKAAAELGPPNVGTRELLCHVQLEADDVINAVSFVPFVCTVQKVATNQHGVPVGYVRLSNPQDLDPWSAFNLPTFATFGGGRPLQRAHEINCYLATYIRPRDGTVGLNYLNAKLLSGAPIRPTQPAPALPPAVPAQPAASEDNYDTQNTHDMELFDKPSYVSQRRRSPLRPPQRQHQMRQTGTMQDSDTDEDSGDSDSESHDVVDYTHAWTPESASAQSHRKRVQPRGGGPVRSVERSPTSRRTGASRPNRGIHRRDEQSEGSDSFHDAEVEEELHVSVTNGRQEAQGNRKRLPRGQIVWRRIDRVVPFQEFDYLIYPSDLEELVDMCESDLWHWHCHGITMLKSYLRYTLMRVVEQQRVYECVVITPDDVEERWAFAFNTGLFHKSYLAPEIYGIAYYNEPKDKFQMSFKRDMGPDGVWGSSGFLFPTFRDIPRPNLAEYPERATYTDGEDVHPALLHFDHGASTLMMRELNLEHILGLSKARDPLSRWTERAKRIKRLPPSFHRFIGRPEDEDMLNAELMWRVKEALSVTIRKATANPRIGVPQYYRPGSGVASKRTRGGLLQMLLPVTFNFEGEHKTTTCAIVLSLEARPSGKEKPPVMVYKVGTLLTLDMALMNARVVQQFGPNWLEVERHGGDGGSVAVDGGSV